MEVTLNEPFSLPTGNNNNTEVVKKKVGCRYGLNSRDQCELEAMCEIHQYCGDHMECLQEENNCFYFIPTKCKVCCSIIQDIDKALHPD